MKISPSCLVTHTQQIIEIFKKKKKKKKTHTHTHTHTHGKQVTVLGMTIKQMSHTL
jgi:hypothetical protein